MAGLARDAEFKCLDFQILDRLAECALALCFDQEAIDVTAEPGLACPTITVPALARLEFGEIEEHHRPAEGSILSP